MASPARALPAADVHRLLEYVTTQRHPDRNRVIVLLSFKAGLRACEIAGLDWTAVLRPDGSISDQLVIPNAIAKMGSGRRIPLHPDLRAGLQALHRNAGRPISGAIVRSERGGHLSPGGLVNWFTVTYAALGMTGCSSHSGRRTFITRSARLIAKSGGSLRDIQELAGHRAITTTERYIEGDRDAQRRLIRLI